MHKAQRAPSPDTIAPDGVEVHNLVDGPQGAQKLSLAEGAVGPNQRSQKVYHTTYEEIWYYVRGEGVFHLHTPGALAEESNTGESRRRGARAAETWILSGKYGRGGTGVSSGGLSTVGNGPGSAALTHLGTIPKRGMT